MTVLQRPPQTPDLNLTTTSSAKNWTSVLNLKELMEDVELVQCYAIKKKTTFIIDVQLTNQPQLHDSIMPILAKIS